MSAELTVGTRIDHDKYGEGVVSKVKITTYEIFFARGGKVEISKSAKDYEVLEKPEAAASSSYAGSDIDIDAVEKVLTYVLDKYGALQEEVQMGSRWIDGTMILKPINPAHQPKEIPIEAFFHKIVMLRDRLRVLEQNINSNERLNDEEKINLQQYITRIYGSLTTFNILFSEKEHQFIGTGGK